MPMLAIACLLRMRSLARLAWCGPPTLNWPLRPTRLASSTQEEPQSDCLMARIGKLWLGSTLPISGGLKARCAMPDNRGDPVKVLLRDSRGLPRHLAGDHVVHEPGEVVGERERRRRVAHDQRRRAGPRLELRGPGVNEAGEQEAP